METKELKRQWFLLHDNSNVFYDRLLSARGLDRAMEYAKVGFSDFTLRLATMKDLIEKLNTSQGYKDTDLTRGFQPLFVENHNKITMIDILD